MHNTSHHTKIIKQLPKRKALGEYQITNVALKNLRNKTILYQTNVINHCYYPAV